MPYRIEKIGAGQWAIRNLDTGKVVGVSDTKEKAEASVRARYAGERGLRKGTKK